MPRVHIENNSDLSNKHVRFMKWKSYGLQRKFKHLLYTEIYLRQEGENPTMYYVVIKLGITGHDIVIRNKSSLLSQLFKNSIQDSHRYLNKTKNRLIEKRISFNKNIDVAI